MSGLLATAVALVGGIPLAFWIDRILKDREEKKQAKSERKRELELLDLLQEELSFTNALFQHRTQHPTAPMIQPLKSALWEAVSAAGKLNLIQNHRLLNRIASAYYLINVVRRIEEQAYQALRISNVQYLNGRTVEQVLWQDARGFDELLSESIREALHDIDEERKKVA